MRSIRPIGLCLLLLAAPLVLCLDPADYEELGRQSAESGDYALAAQHYARAADAYADVGNSSAAAINHERAASFYSAIDSTADYEEQAGKAAAAYGRAGQDYLDSGRRWYAANAFARSAMFYNATGKSAEYRQMQIKAGNTYMDFALEAENSTQGAQALYRAAAAFYGLDSARFAAAKDQLTDLIDALTEDALKSKDLAVFDVIDLYYLPLYSQVLGDDLSSARKYTEAGDLATTMGAYAYAAGYYSSSAIFYAYSDRGTEANASLSLAADACWREASRYDGWNYTTYLDSKDYLEMALYMLAYLGKVERIPPIEEQATSWLTDLGEQLESESELLYSSGDYEGSASNYSAAGEVLYIVGREDAFRSLNGASGSSYLILGDLAKESGNLSFAAARYEQAGYLLRLGGNDTYKQAYAKAAGIYSQLGDDDSAAGNLTLAASDFWGAASYYDVAGNPAAALTHYLKFISILRSLAESNPNSRGSLLVSIGDALKKAGRREEAEQAYGEASDELVQILGAYMNYYPDYLPSIPSLPMSLVKAYRMSGRLYLARNVVNALDFPAMYDTLSILASMAQLYRTAARVYTELAESSISVYDFQNYAVDQLMAGLSSVVASDLEGARRSLRAFEGVSSDLHSSSRKFHQLLARCVAWLETGDAGSLQEAHSVLQEIRSVAQDSQTDFLLEDLNTRLDAPVSLDEQLSLAQSEAASRNWSGAGEAYWVAAHLAYFSEDFDRSLSNFEDSSYCYIKAERYLNASESANLAYETQLEPSNYIIGLQTLTAALTESNRTKAGLAKASFKQAVDDGYKVEKSRELLEIASDLAGVRWGPVIGQLAVGIAAALSVITVVVILRKRSED